jgi:diguanylate cyclase (GGDEF)-like protein/PAS domain S-box-containing protein
MALNEEYYKKVLDNLYDGIYLLDEERRIIYWNSGAEKHTGYSHADVFMKRCDEVLRHVNDEGVPLCGKSCPVSQTIADGCLREVEVFLHHKEGHRLPVSMRIAPIKGSANQVVIAVEIFNDESPKFTLRQMLEEMKTRALLDPLLELGNRRFIENTINGRLEELNRYGWQFGILFIDLDHFKMINDAYGHETGDRVLQTVSKTMSNTLRSFDVLGRWGGEEFVAIVVNVVETQLYAVANRMRLLVEQSSISSGESIIRPTVSIGATLALPDDDIISLVQRADSLMYKSKDAGRNCITVHI